MQTPQSGCPTAPPLPGSALVPASRAGGGQTPRKGRARGRGEHCKALPEEPPGNKSPEEQRHRPSWKPRPEMPPPSPPPASEKQASGLCGLRPALLGIWEKASPHTPLPWSLGPSIFPRKGDSHSHPLPKETKAVPLGMEAPCRSRILTLGLSLLCLLCMELTLCQPPHKRLRVLEARPTRQVLS